ncbi:MAG: M15 family metallopeptidase [Leptolyngbyaceae bacterium]|nr:M15 family metallopeptidase [Leptolyngbyaceae bacterium]
MPPSYSDDIPEALRESTPKQSTAPSSAQTSLPLLWIGGVGMVAVALGAITALLWQPILSHFSGINDGSPEETVDNGDNPVMATPGTSDPNTTTADAANGANATDDATDELLGHRRYDEAPEDTLVPVVGDGSIRLRETAAKSFTEMANAARTQGVLLQPLSGFRTEAEQEYLFFEVKKNRRQSSQERATVSAPPGYSEHHTGYAIDIGDPNQPSTHLEASFAETPAFEWLEENAAAYGFELSFEGVSNSTVNYEPWHWRYVGDRHSLETFYGNSGGADSQPLREETDNDTDGEDNTTSDTDADPRSAPEAETN